MPTPPTTAQRGLEKLKAMNRMRNHLSAQRKASAEQQAYALARLQAAAPDLLAALIKCAEQLDRETLGGEALDAARLAIQRATA